MERDASIGRWVLPATVVLVVLGLALSAVVRIASPDPARLEIDSTPVGTTVFVNGTYRGVTPLTVERLYPGEHMVRLVCTDHDSWQSKVDVHEGENRVRAELVRRRGGTLTVHSRPVGATVYVDGERKGVTPLTVPDMDPGTHVVRLVQVNYLEWEAQVEVRRGREVPVEANLKSRVEDYLLRATRERPNDVQTWTELFHYYIISHEFEKAPEALSRALVTSQINTAAGTRIDSELGKIWSGQREVRYGGPEEIEKARQSILRGLELTVELSPSNVNHSRRLLTYYIQAEQTEKANLLLEKGLEQFEGDRNWYMTRDLTSRGPRGPQSGMQDLLDLLTKVPQDNVARLQVTTQLEQDGKLEEAVAQYPELLKRMKSDAVRFGLWQSLGNLQERLGHAPQAVDSYRQALKIDVRPALRAMLLYRVVRLKREAGQIEESISTWEEAIAIQPDIEYACRWRLALADLCLTRQMFDKTRALCSDVLRISQDQDSRKRARATLDKLPES